MLRSMPDSNEDLSQMSFEAALRELEGVVRQLEGGDVALEESITLYERGEKLRGHCQARLNAAQARIEKIVQDGEGRAVGTAPLDADG